MRLSAEKVALERGGRLLFADLSLEVEAGEALVIVGPNGAGKSSLLRAIAGLLPLQAGRIELRGGEADASVGEQAHYLGHSDALKGALTPAENLGFWAGVLGGDPGSEACGRALARLGLAHAADFPVNALSAGQRRRVALARLLIAARPLWLLDEPTTALDAGARALFADVMGEHQESGGLILAATHAPLGLQGARTLYLGAAESDAA